MTPPPKLRRVDILWSHHRDLDGKRYQSLAEAEEAIARAMVFLAGAGDGPESYQVTFRVVWEDDFSWDGHAPLHGPALWTGVLREAIQRAAMQALAWAKDPRTPQPQRDRNREWADDIQRRLDAEPAMDLGARNAAEVNIPAVTRVDILDAEGNAVAPGTHPSLAAADRAIVRAYRRHAPPDLSYDKIRFRVRWADGAEHDGRVDVGGKTLARASTDGILHRHLKGIGQWLLDNAKTWPAWTPAQQAERTAWGTELLRRLSVDEPGADPRNAADGTAPTLLPDPADALRALHADFLERRPSAPDETTEAEATDIRVPATTHRDVRWIVNYVSQALRVDLQAFDPETYGVIWSHWRIVVDTIRTLLRVGGEDDAYVDNRGLWLRQLPTLVSLVSEGLRRAAASTNR